MRQIIASQSPTRSDNTYLKRSVRLGRQSRWKIRKHINMKKYLFVLLVLCLLSCERSKEIGKHFQLTTFDSEEFSLVFLSNEDTMFRVLDKKIAAYCKCGSTIFIVQYPMETNGKVNEQDPQYYIIDSNVDYSDERVRPKPIEKSRFDSMLHAGCGGQSLIYL
jgi:hypothetical protein